MAQQFRVLATLREEPGLKPSTYMTAQNCLTLILGDPTLSFGPHIYRQNSNVHKIKKKLKTLKKSLMYLYVNYNTIYIFIDN